MFLKQSTVLRNIIGIAAIIRLPILQEIKTVVGVNTVLAEKESTADVPAPSLRKPAFHIWGKRKENA